MRALGTGVPSTLFVLEGEKKYLVKLKCDKSEWIFKKGFHPIVHLNKWIIASLLTPERPFTLIYVRKIKRPKGPRLDGAIEEFWSLESTFVC